jgi:hypothetical protein
MIYIQINNPSAAAAQQLGFIGELAADVAPNYVAAKVDQAAADQISAALAAQGIMATVSVQPPAGAPSSTSELLGLGAAALVGFIVGSST